MVAIDGSTVRVHTSYQKQGYKSTSNRTEARKLILLSSALDVHSRTCVDMRTSNRFNERECATAHMEQLSAGDTVRFDRGTFRTPC
jgi:hypothetical protein